MAQFVCLLNSKLINHFSQLLITVVNKRNILLLSLLFFIACKSIQHEKKFDETQWAVKNETRYPHRDEMLNDLMEHHDLHGVKKDSVLIMLGAPDRSDNGYLFYEISRQQLGIITLHTKTLVIKLNADSTVQWLKIHQ